MTRPARTSGVAGLQRLFAASAESERRRVPVDELLGQAADVRSALQGECGAPGARGLTRRGFLVGGAGLLAGAALVTRPRASAASAARSPTAPRVAIVGAGLAGLALRAHALDRRARATGRVDRV